MRLVSVFYAACFKFDYFIGKQAKFVFLNATCRWNFPIMLVNYVAFLLTFQAHGLCV